MEKKTPNQSSEEIVFRPLSEGLGFHPFSDGLPYAPMAKNPKTNSSVPLQSSMGAGAVAAGPPKMAVPSQVTQKRPEFPEFKVPQVSVPVVKPEAALPKLTQQVATAPFKSDPLKSETQELTDPFGYSYVLKRLLAFWIDLVMSFGFCVGVLSSFVWIQESNAGVLFHPSVLVVMMLFAFGMHWTLVMLQEVIFKTTVGKRIFGLNFKASGTALFIRALFFVPSVLFLGLGLIWCLFDRQKRCWHDRALGIQPLEVARL